MISKIPIIIYRNIVLICIFFCIIFSWSCGSFYFHNIDCHVGSSCYAWGLSCYETFGWVQSRWILNSTKVAQLCKTNTYFFIIIDFASFVLNVIFGPAISHGNSIFCYIDASIIAGYFEFVACISVEIAFETNCWKFMNLLILYLFCIVVLMSSLN